MSDNPGREFGVAPDPYWEASERPEPKPPYDVQTEDEKSENTETILRHLRRIKGGADGVPVSYDEENQAELIAKAIAKAGEDIEDLSETEQYWAVKQLSNMYDGLRSSNTAPNSETMATLITANNGLDGLATRRNTDFDVSAANKNLMEQYLANDGVVANYVRDEFDDAWVDPTAHMAKIHTLAREVIEELGLEDDLKAQQAVYLTTYNKVMSAADSTGAGSAEWSAAEKAALRNDVADNVVAGAYTLSTWTPYKEARRRLTDAGEAEGATETIQYEAFYNTQFLDNSSDVKDNPATFASLYTNQAAQARALRDPGAAVTAPAGQTAWENVAAQQGWGPGREEDILNLVGGSIGFQPGQAGPDAASINMAMAQGLPPGTFDTGSPAMLLNEASRVNFYGGWPEELGPYEEIAGPQLPFASPDKMPFIRKELLADYWLGRSPAELEQLQLFLRSHGFLDGNYVRGIFDDNTWAALDAALEGIDRYQGPAREFLETSRRSFESQVMDEQARRRDEIGPPPVQTYTSRESIADAIQSSALRQTIGYDLPESMVDQIYNEVHSDEQAFNQAYYEDWRRTHEPVNAQMKDLLAALNMTEAYGNEAYLGDLGQDPYVGPFQIGEAWFHEWGRDAGLESPDISNVDHHWIIAEHRLGMYLEIFGGNTRDALAAWSAGLGGARSYDRNDPNIGPGPNQSINAYIDKTLGYLRNIQNQGGSGLDQDPIIVNTPDPMATMRTTIRESDDYKAGLIRQNMNAFFDMLSGVRGVGAMTRGA